ncbi:hypothetical protein GRF29_8g3344743 [Pseudopithomyces chartarum]|uniref:Uncharacterized protein n=1 Tax=Pseudopithomyces chartarum TaxID=1892770 RepID=A0AAN6M777_9PLEO|nr:hypothetical protein GRF29_8g3344743 [Pseudopithomyces chartarum]
MPSPPTTPLNPTATPTPIQPTAPTTFPLTPLTPSTPPTLPPSTPSKPSTPPKIAPPHHPLNHHLSPPSPTIPSISLAHSLAIARLRPVDRFLAQLDRDIQDFKRWLDHRDEYPVSGGGKRGSGSEATEGANGDKKMEELELPHFPA